MQDLSERKFKDYLQDKGYKPLRHNGGSHTIYERIISHKVSVPFHNGIINGCVADKITKQIENIDNICLSNGRRK